MSGDRTPPCQPSRLRITSDTADACKVRQGARTVALQMGFPDKEVAAIVLAVDEAVCNVIKHGYDGCGGQPIDVALEPVCVEGRWGLRITVEDEGRHVDPEQIVGRDLAEVRPGGLGTHIIRAVMDQVEYAQRQPRGMRLTLLKMLDAPPASPVEG